MVFAFPGPVVMPSRFCLPLHSGALSLAWDLGHFTACVAQRLLDPSVHPPPHRPPGGLWGLGEARQMVFVCWGKRLSSRNKGKQESLLWESTYVPGPGKSRPGPWGQWMGYEGYGRSCSLDLPPAALGNSRKLSQGIPSLCLFTLSYQLP